MPDTASSVQLSAATDGIGNAASSSTAASEAADLDDFGLPIRKRKATLTAHGETEGAEDVDGPKEEERNTQGKQPIRHSKPASSGSVKDGQVSESIAEQESEDNSSEEEFKDAQSTPNPEPQIPQETALKSVVPETNVLANPRPATQLPKKTEVPTESDSTPQEITAAAKEVDFLKPRNDAPANNVVGDSKPQVSKSTDEPQQKESVQNSHVRQASSQGQGISEWSHQHLTQPEEAAPETEEDEWQTMPAFAPYDMYDDDNKLIAREAHDSDNENDAYAGLGGAGKGYTRVQLDEDAQSATSLDENTQYLFKDINGGTGAGEEEDEEQRDALSQMQATKDLLTEGQRIAYVGMTRLILAKMVKMAESLGNTKSKTTKKEIQTSAENMRMWSQKMMVRLYTHMDISTAEQIMIEQLSEHGVVPLDLTPTLMQNARVKNPMAEDDPSKANLSSPGADSAASSRMSLSSRPTNSVPLTSRLPQIPGIKEEEAASVPPPYQEHEGEDLPEVRTPSQLPTTEKIDIDLRWTVLCDLFLTLIADSIYDSRSRVLLELVGENMEVSWLDICKFEKRVTDALEMQQSAEKENWNEDDHKENRRKLALKKRYVMMGLATVGGSLVIGLSAGLLAPLIGAGLAAGFSTIGVAGTTGFLAGAGGAAIITSSAAASGGIIAVRAADRRTGAVKTFEYRPLHNNKRVNLIVTVSGWMTGKVDDVRLPYSTIDPIMGDIYSVLWEPEMLTSMGDTINILATEALTQGLQQVLGSTILIGLMAALQLPVVLTKLAYLIDNPWTVSLDRANAAGLILADSLIDRNLGTRPITFVGYSLGSRVIFSCLRELSRKGAYGLVQNVFLFGSPIVAKKDEYLKARSVVAGRFVNGYAKNDWILGYLFRLTSGGISRVAGLAPVEEIPAMENIDVTELVPGHMSYRTAMPRLLREVGWVVESDEFTEIEDPDPENHTQRQRELINEIEEARKEFEKKEKESKGRFSFFGRKKKAAVEKAEWETYEESKGDSAYDSRVEEPSQGNNGVLFDVDAMRSELASEQLEVKELKSTLPPMKLDLASPTSSNPKGSLREMNTATMLKPDDYKSPFPSPRGSAGHDKSVINHPYPHTQTGFEEEIQMTFDEPYHTPLRPSSTTPLSKTLPPLPSPIPSPIPSSAYGRDTRPGLRTSQTMPAPAINLGHNAWADDEDDDFGQEKEVQMTFA